jgi:hypothetical protein
MVHVSHFENEPPKMTEEKMNTNEATIFPNRYSDGLHIKKLKPMTSY